MTRNVIPSCSLCSWWAWLALRVWEDGKGQLSHSTKSDDLGIFKTTAHIVIFPLRTEQRINGIPFHLFYVLLVSSLVETGVQIWSEYSPSRQEDPDLRGKLDCLKIGRSSSNGSSPIAALLRKRRVSWTHAMFTQRIFFCLFFKYRE